MKNLFTAVVLLALAPLASAQIRDGSYWTDGKGNTCTVDVTEVPNADGSTSTVVTVTDSTGFTQPVNGTASPGSTEEHPSVQAFPSTHTNADPGNEYRGRNGRVQRKVGGKWQNYRPGKKPKRGLSRSLTQPGPDDSGSLPDFTGPEPL